jgi:hypothetical protein
MNEHIHVLHTDIPLDEIHANWIARIRQHASEHYNEQGWDFVVESFDNEDLIRNFVSPLSQAHPCTTYAEALAAVTEHVELLNERRLEIRSEAW